MQAKTELTFADMVFAFFVQARTRELKSDEWYDVIQCFREHLMSADEQILMSAIDEVASGKCDLAPKDRPNLSKEKWREWFMRLYLCAHPEWVWKKHCENNEQFHCPDIIADACGYQRSF